MEAQAALPLWTHLEPAERTLPTFPNALLAPDQAHVLARTSAHGGITAVTDGEDVIVHAGGGAFGEAAAATSERLEAVWSSAGSAEGPAGGPSSSSSSAVRALAWSLPSQADGAAPLFLAVASGSTVHVFDVAAASQGQQQAPTPAAPQCRWAGGVHLRHDVRGVAWRPGRSAVLAVLTQVRASGPCVLPVAFPSLRTPPVSQRAVLHVQPQHGVTVARAQRPAASEPPAPPVPTATVPATAGAVTFLAHVPPPGDRPCSATALTATWLGTGDTTASHSAALVVAWGAHLELICWPPPLIPPAEHDDVDWGAAPGRRDARVALPVGCGTPVALAALPPGAAGGRGAGPLLLVSCNAGIQLQAPAPLPRAQEQAQPGSNGHAPGHAAAAPTQPPLLAGAAHLAAPQQRAPIVLLGGTDNSGSGSRAPLITEVLPDGDVPSPTAPPDAASSSLPPPSVLLQGGLLTALADHPPAPPAAALLGQQLNAGGPPGSSTRAVPGALLLPRDQGGHMQPAGALVLMQLEQGDGPPPGGALPTLRCVAAPAPLFIPRAQLLSSAAAAPPGGASGPAGGEEAAGAVLALASATTPAAVQLVQLHPVPPSTLGEQRETAAAARPPRPYALTTLGMLSPPPSVGRHAASAAGAPGDQASLRFRGVTLAWDARAPQAGGAPRLRLHVLQGLHQAAQRPGEPAAAGDAGRGGHGGAPTASAAAPAFTLLSRQGPIRQRLSALQLASYALPGHLLLAGGSSSGTTTTTISHEADAGMSGPSTVHHDGGATVEAGGRHKVASAVAAAPAQHGESGRVRAALAAARAAVEAEFEALRAHVGRVELGVRRRFEELERQLLR